MTPRARHKRSGPREPPPTAGRRSPGRDRSGPASRPRHPPGPREAPFSLRPTLSPRELVRPPEEPWAAGRDQIPHAHAAGRPLNVVMVGWEYPPYHSGGLGVHSYEITREMALLGHRVVFLTPFSGPFLPAPGVEFRHPGDRPGRGELEGASGLESYGGILAFGADLPRGVQIYDDWIASIEDLGAVDIVHAHDWFGTRGALRLARRLGVPLITTIHSTEWDRSMGHPWSDILAREEFGVANADRVIAVSQHLARQLLERYGADPARVRVIYNSVRVPAKPEGRPPTRDVVLYLGRLAAMKGVDTFLKAAARIAGDFPEIRFVIAGEGPEYPRLIHLANELGIAERVTFLGWISEGERTALFADTSVFVLPSVVEPFGIAALEALAAGVPSLLSKTSGVAEVIPSAFHIDFWDVDEFASRMAELLSYPALSREMARRGREEATRETWPEKARQTIDVYREAIRSRGGSG